MNVRSAVDLLKETYKSWSEDKAPRLAAALSYYTIFSVAPLMIIAVAIASLIFRREAATGQIVAQIQHTVGPQAAQAIQEMVRHASRPSSGIIGSAIGIVTLLLGAGGVFGQLQDALNTVWEVAPKPGRSVLAMLKERFLSYSMTVGVGFLLLVSLVLSAGLVAMTKYMGHAVPWLSAIGPLLDLLLSIAVFTLLFAMIFKVLPDAEVAWRDVWIGALMTAVLFALGKFLIGLYLGRSTVASAYGAAGSLVVLLLWVYYSAQILLFGAEFTKVYALKCGSRIVPAPDAVPVSHEARAQQGLPPRRAPTG